MESRRISADALTECRKAEGRLKMIDIRESMAQESESAATQTLRFSFAKRYRGWIGVFPEQRDALREALRNRIKNEWRSDETVDEIVQRIGSSGRTASPGESAGQ